MGKPQQCTVVEPELSDITVSNGKMIGIRGTSGNTNIVLCDATDDTFVGILAHTGDIYIDAAKSINVDCKTYHKAVTEEIKFFSDTFIHDNISTYTLRTNDANFHINNAYDLTVVGTFTEKIGTHKVEAQSQTVDIAKNQTITVLGDQKTNVKGDVTQIYDKNRKTTITGTDDIKVNGETTWMKFKDSFDICAAYENKITFSEKTNACLSAEASLNIGTSEKINIATSFEQNFAIKHVINNSISCEHNNGIKKGINAVLDLTDNSLSKQKADIKDIYLEFAKQNSKIVKMTSKVMLLE